MRIPFVAVGVFEFLRKVLPLPAGNDDDDVKGLLLLLETEGLEDFESCDCAVEEEERLLPVLRRPVEFGVFVLPRWELKDPCCCISIQ